MSIILLLWAKYSAYIKNSSVYLLATIISSIIGVAINPLLALNLSPEDYAIVGYYTGYSTLFTEYLSRLKFILYLFQLLCSDRFIL